jgi:ATP-dependent Clp protease adaptor protein ClpS
MVSALSRRAGRRRRDAPELAILRRRRPMPNDPREREDRQGDLATQKKNRAEKIRRYKVVFHNDNYTTMEFVVLVLMKFFHKTETEATHIMLSVHHKGSGVAGVYTKDVAETKVTEVQSYAKEQSMPLRLTVEPE